MRLIDCHKAKRAIYQHKTQRLQKETVLKILDSAPTIDAVEVVRCKDCRKFAPYSEKFKNEHPDSKDGTCMMQAMCGYEWQDARRYAGRYNDDFCSRGERKEAD